MKILFINRNDSKCGVCGKGALPYEKTHATIAAYNQTENGKPGCGAEWTHISSYYGGDGIKLASMKLRPDLIWIDFWETLERDTGKWQTFR